jgi:endonuclease III
MAKIISNLEIEKIFSTFNALNPTPITELNYCNDYTLLVAIVLSAQTTDIAVNKATENLFKNVSTSFEMITLGEEKLKQHIKSIGLFNTKAKNVILLSKLLIEKFNNKIPTTIEELESLPGVGRKTANVFLNCAYGIPTIGVDTHVFRVANRIGLTNSTNTLQTENQLIAIIPNRWKKNTHHWLILHGRYICTAKKPKCFKCPISEYCHYKEKTL